MKHIRLDGVGKRRCKRVLVVVKFCIKLMEGALAQHRITLHQKRAERTLGQRFFTPLLVDQGAELHVHVGQLRKRVVVTAERDVAQRQDAFLGL